MKKTIAAVLAAALVFSLAACGDSSAADKGGDASVSSSAVDPSQLKSAEVKETDMLGVFLKSGGEQFMGLTRDQVSEKTGGAFDKKNAAETSNDFDTFSFGKVSSLFGGKFDMGSPLDVKCTLTYKNEKLTFIQYSIGDDEDKSVKTNDIAEKLIEFLRNSLPEDVKEQKAQTNTPKGTARFFNGKEDGYIFTVNKSNIGSTNFPITLKIGDYKSTYGIK